MTAADSIAELSPYAAELRQARGKADLTQADLAARTNYSTALVSMVEQGRRVPTLEFTRRVDEVLGTDGLLERIRSYSLKGAAVPWFAQWIEIEREAVELRSFELAVVPGLLQTEEYIRALLANSNQLRRDQVGEQVIARLARQELLNKATLRAIFVIDESALRRPVGSPSIMGAQLQHLIDVVEQEIGEVQIVPFTAGGYIGVAGAFTLATMVDGAELAYLENPLDGTVVDGVGQWRALWKAWESVRAVALPP